MLLYSLFTNRYLIIQDESRASLHDDMKMEVFQLISE